MSNVSKKMLMAAAGSAGGAGLDVDDCFSCHLYDGTGSAQVIENGIALGNSNDGGSIRINLNSSLESLSHSFAYGTADFTVEFFMWINSVPNQANVLDHRPTGASSTGFFVGFNSSRNLRFNQGSTDHISDSGTVDLGQWYHVAVSRASGTTKMFKNGTQVGSNYSDTNNYTSSTLEIGQRSTSNGNPFDGWITNVRIVLGTALYTSNFTSPTAALTAVSGTALLIGGGDTPLVDQSSNNISFTQVANPVASEFGPFTGSSGEGGLVWIKSRDDTEQHIWSDTVRGVTKYIKSSATSAEETQTQALTAFNSSGFSIGNWADVNTNGDSFVSWTFRNSPMFQVVQYTGTGSAQAIAHNLGSVPGMIITKRTSGASGWGVYHRSKGATAIGTLNGTGGWITDTSFYNDTEPTSTHFTVGSAAYTGQNTETYVAYLFAHHANDGSKTGFGPDGDSPCISCGSYSGNGNDKRVIDLGFEAQWVLLKRYDGTTDWRILDVMRGLTIRGVNSNYLEANTSDAEASVGDIFIDNQGFMLDAGDFNSSGENYIYMAIRRGPLAAPDDATKVFAIDTQVNQDPPLFDSGFPVDFALTRNVASTASWAVASRLIQGKQLNTNNENAETNNPVNAFDFMDGWNNETLSTNSDVYSWMWKRAPSYFDVVCYGGSGSNRTISHNLGVAPEMMWVKSRSNSGLGWMTYHSGTGATHYLMVNSTAAAVDLDVIWNDTAPTSSVFSVGTGGSVNDSGKTYIAYLFATVPNVSKVGTYTGNSSGGKQIDCGFSNGARFVLLKNTTVSDTNWLLFDTVRGIVAGNDARLYLNSTDIQNSGTDYIDPYSSGFALTANAQVNYSGSTYIFYAIA